MKPQKKWNGIAVIMGLALISVILLNLLYSNTFARVYNDNTTVLSKLNVTNRAPVVYNVNLYDSNDPGNIVLEQGTTHLVICNATVNDTNGYVDLNNVNATLYKYPEYGVADANDSNYKYSNATCLQYATSTDNYIQAYYSCQFNVAYYAYNGTWRCNVTAIDQSSAQNSSTDDRDIDPLFAINLSSEQISFGELEPLNISLDQEFNITNFGNMNLTIALRAYGENEGDDWAMNCSVGNISLDYERYAIDSGTAWSGMTPVANSFTDIVGLEVYMRDDDLDTNLVNSTNSTYWKIKAPWGTKGVCNGTIEFSAKNTFA